MKVSVEMAIRNAEALLRMEGLQPSPEILNECRRVANGEISHEQYMSMLRERFMEADCVELQS